jgi:small conductance mechanosensitive channel
MVGILYHGGITFPHSERVIDMVSTHISLRVISFVLQTSTPSGSGTVGNTSNGSVEEGTQKAVGFLTKVLPEWIPVWSLRLGLALFVLVIAWYSSEILVRLFGRRIARRFRRRSIRQAALRSIRGGVMVIAVFIAIAVYGVNLGDILISATVLAAAIGVLLAPIVGSLISGMFVLADRPYDIGDMIELPETDQRGFVEDITLRHTKITTIHNSILVIPNEQIRDLHVINHTIEDSRVRLRMDLLVTYEGDLTEARAIMERAAREVDAVIPGGPDIRVGSTRYPAAPTCYISAFADHGVLLTLRYWAREPYVALGPPFSVPSRIRENIWTMIDDADVEIAYPHTHHVFDSTSGDLSLSLGNDASPQRPPDSDDEDSSWEPWQ